MRPRVKNRKLLLFSAAVLVVVAALTYATTLFAGIYNEMELLARYLESFPHIVDERTSKLEGQYSAYYEDGAVRGALCATLYSRNDDLADRERLQLAKESVNALDVLVVDDAGNVVSFVEGADALEDEFPGVSKLYDKAVLADVVQGETSLFDPNLQLAGNEEADEAGAEGRDASAEKGEAGDGAAQGDDAQGQAEASSAAPPVLPLVCSVPVGSDHGNNVVTLLDYTSMGEALANYGSWDTVLERLLSGLDGYAFFVAGDAYTGYPLDSFSAEERRRLGDDLRDELTSGSSLFPVTLEDGQEASYGTVTLLDQVHLALTLKMPEAGPDAQVVVAVPTKSFMSSAILCDVVLVALVACGLMLFVRYARRIVRRERQRPDDAPARTKALRRHTRAGLVVMCVVTAIVCVMLFMLEDMASTAHIAMTQRDAIRFESDYGAAQRRATMDEYADRYITRANALAQLLSTNPELRTRDDLVRLADDVGVDYLMLFDRDGNELFSSNAYTGFVVSVSEDDPTSAFRPVLNGYPYVSTEPAKNEVTGSYEHAVASLVTDEEGLADGFLLLSVNDDALMGQLRDVSLEGTVNSFATQEGETVAVVGEKDCLFVAHTDASKIGEPAADYLDASVLGRDFEGFTWYDGEYAYVSGSYDAKKTTVVIARSDASGTAFVESCLLIALYSLVFCVLFFPVATRLCAKEDVHAPGAKKDKSRPIVTFFHGYVVFFAFFACFALAASRRLEWRGFDFVFEQRWTRNVNLFSLWTALFVFSVTLTVVFAIRTLLRRAEEQVGSQTRTLMRLTDSLVTYATVMVLGVYILSLFGVDTTAMLASAGIASIAVGMGAKDLITDILAGLLIIFEGTIHVGDIVEIGRWRGVVTDMGVRTTEITNDSNDVMIITNSRISEVINMSRAKTLCFEEFGLPRTVEASQVPAIFERCIARVTEKIPELRGSLAYEGITQVSERDYTVRVSYSCNEADREALTFRLRTALQLLLEDDDALCG